jgi:hypothetical protein
MPVAVVSTDVSEELSASLIRVKIIGELGTKIAVNSNRLTLTKEALSSSERRFFQEPHGVTSQKTLFFIVTAVKTSNLTFVFFVYTWNLLPRGNAWTISFSELQLKHNKQLYPAST